jgi:DNA-binding NarL/FixJ family response regulator
MDADFRIICEVADGLEAIEKSKELQPDVALLDISMPQMGGFEAARQILAAAPQTEIILLTEHAVSEMAQAALDRGIRGYVIKSDAAQELGIAIRTVIRQKSYVSAGLVVQGK